MYHKTKLSYGKCCKWNRKVYERFCARMILTVNVERSLKYNFFRKTVPVVPGPMLLIISF